MHFKIAVILCALYLFTVAVSTGLNNKQIDQFIASLNYIKSVSNQVGKQEAVQLQIYLGYYPNFFTGSLNNKTAPSFLVLLADVDKNTDDWKEKGFTSYEINYFVSMFNAANNDTNPSGLIAGEKLRNLIDVEFNLETNIKDSIKSEFQNSELINAPMFLAAIVKHKPEGRGLNAAMIEKCVDIYNNNIMKNDHVKPEGIIEVFNILNIVANVNKYNVLFKYQRRPARDLEEMLILFTDYNNVVDDKVPGVLPSAIVKKIMSEFNLVENKYGVIGHEEIIKIVEENCENDNAKNIKAALNDDETMNIAQLLLLITSTIKPISTQPETE